MIPWISRLATVRRESFWGHIGYVSCHKIAEEENQVDHPVPTAQLQAHPISRPLLFCPGASSAYSLIQHRKSNDP